MARDVRKGTGSLVPTMSSALLICLAVAVAALGRIRLKSEENRLYGDINRIEAQLQDARRLNRKLQSDYEVLTSSLGLNARMREMNLNLMMPGDAARVVQPEPGMGTPSAPEMAWRPARPEPQVAAGGGEVATQSRNR